MKILSILLLTIWLYIPVAGSFGASATAAAIVPFVGAPLCPYHDRHVYHALWNDQLGCHYNHTHGDNPHSVDDIFGTDYYEWADGEISYPWQTAHEATHKHQTYKWVVRRDLPCTTDPKPDCVSALRAQLHADLFNVASAHHSFYVEALLCPKATPTDCGIVRYGGWQNSGPLLIDGQVVIPGNQALGEKRHFDLTDNRHRAVWYLSSASDLARVNFMTADLWGYYPMPPTIPITGTLTTADMVLFGTPADNASRFKPYSAQFAIAYRHRATLDPDANGYADYAGWVNRYGEFVTNCDVGPYWDCVPVAWQHVKIPAHSYQVEFGLGSDIREYDIFFNGQSSNWIVFPN